MKSITNGLILSTILAFFSWGFSFYLPIGGVAIAIVVGMIVGNSFSLNKKFNEGITFSEKSVLGFSIALMGINLDFSILNSLGLKTVFIIIFGMIATIFVGIFLGKLLKVDTKLSLLVSIGNGVCGSSAIGATAPILKADKTFIGVSVAVVNLLGTVGIFLLPPLTLFLGLDSIDSGVLIGNTLQAVGHVTAAGFAVGDLSGVSATTVKMGRVLLLTPLVLILIYIFAKKQKDQESSVKFPRFILFFIGFSLVGSLSLLPETLESAISATSHFALMVAMVGVGLKIELKHILTTGGIALKLATLLFIFQIIFSALLLLAFF